MRKHYYIFHMIILMAIFSLILLLNYRFFEKTRELYQNFLGIFE